MTAQRLPLPVRTARKPSFMPPEPLRFHHAAIICSNYALSRSFYTEILGLPILAEEYRAGRESYKLNLGVDGGGEIELFSFPFPPTRPSYPEACGLRHLAFAVRDINAFHAYIASHHLQPEPIRDDRATGKRFFFFADPDNLPIEIYET